MLCDGMGLGKTLNALCLIALDEKKNEKNKKMPTLIICKKTILKVWENEMNKHFKGMLFYFTYKSVLYIIEFGYS